MAEKEKLSRFECSDGECAVFGLVRLKNEVVADHDVLGRVLGIRVGECEGALHVPQMPRELSEDSYQQLLHPEVLEKFPELYAGQKWGIADRNPKGEVRVQNFLLKFCVDKENVNLKAEEIHAKFIPWFYLFNSYWELLTRQRKRPSVFIQNGGSELRIFWQSEGGKLSSDYEKPRSTVLLSPVDKESWIGLNQLSGACRFASEGKPLPLELRMQLSAYRALEVKDFRKSILETSAAAEVALTESIRAEFSRLGLDYGEKIMKAFRMLSGRLELARAMKLGVPSIDFKSALVNPRNEVMHKATLVQEKVAHAAVDATDSLLIGLGLHLRVNK